MDGYQTHPAIQYSFRWTGSLTTFGGSLTTFTSNQHIPGLLRVFAFFFGSSFGCLTAFHIHGINPSTWKLNFKLKVEGIPSASFEEFTNQKLRKSQLEILQVQISWKQKNTAKILRWRSDKKNLLWALYRFFFQTVSFFVRNWGFLKWCYPKMDGL